MGAMTSKFFLVMFILIMIALKNEGRKHNNDFIDSLSPFYLKFTVPRNRGQNQDIRHGVRPLVGRGVIDTKKGINKVTNNKTNEVASFLDIFYKIRNFFLGYDDDEKDDDAL